MYYCKLIYLGIFLNLLFVLFKTGVDGIIIIDTTESSDVAIKILKEFRKITKKPLKAIVITHFHAGLSLMYFKN